MDWPLVLPIQPAELSELCFALKPMEKFKEHVIPFLENGYIRYLAEGVAKLMSAEYFQQNFIYLAKAELPNIGHSYFYYQNKEYPESVMRFRISPTAGFSATIILYRDYENQFSVIGKL